MDTKEINAAFSSARDVARLEAKENFEINIPADNANMEDVRGAEVIAIMNYVDSLVLKTLNNLLAD